MLKGTGIADMAVDVAALVVFTALIMAVALFRFRTTLD
jgi:hypothetical protein